LQLLLKIIDRRICETTPKFDPTQLSIFKPLACQSAPKLRAE